MCCIASRLDDLSFVVGTFTFVGFIIHLPTPTAVAPGYGFNPRLRVCLFIRTIFQKAM